MRAGEGGATPAPACRLCGAAPARPLFERDGIPYFECVACDFLFDEPGGGELEDRNARRWGHPDERYTDPARAAQRDRRGRRYAARVEKMFGPWRRLNRLLEVGCREGHFVAAARDGGWEATGVEVEVEPARFGRERFGIDIRVGTLEEARLPDAHFDAVYANEVWEHLRDPVTVTREVARVLRPGGVAVIKTGNRRSWTARAIGPAWQYYRFREWGHVSFFSPRSFRALAERAGLEVAGIRTKGLRLQNGHRAGWRGVASKLLEPLADATGNGDRLWLTATKPGGEAR